MAALFWAGHPIPLQETRAPVLPRAQGCLLLSQDCASIVSLETLLQKPKTRLKTARVQKGPSPSLQDPV